MAYPLASVEHYEASFTPLPPDLSSKLGALLARASRKVRAECGEVDDRIASGEIDAELVADIVCEMVERAGSVPAGVVGGVASVQQGAGPYQQTLTFSDVVGRLYVGKDAKRQIGCGRQEAFTVPMVTEVPPCVYPWEQL